MSSSTSSPIPQIWRNISSSGNLQRKRGNEFDFSMLSGADGEASASNQSEILAPIPVAPLSTFPINGQGSRFVEDLERLASLELVDTTEDVAGPSRRPGITIIDNPTPRPAQRQPPSRPPSPYVVRPGTPMGTSRAQDLEEWVAMDHEQWDAAGACNGLIRAFGNVRQQYKRVFDSLFGRLERLSSFSFKYARFLNAIKAVEKILARISPLMTDSTWYAYDDISKLVDFFAEWIVDANNCYNAMTLDRTPPNLDDPEERAGRKSLMMEMEPELARLAGQLDTYAQKPLDKLRVLLKEHS